MKLEAMKRAAGTGASLRRTGRIPAVIYNRDMNQTVSVDLKAFDRVFRSQGTSHVIDLEVDGAVVPVLVKAVQMDKRRRIAQHADFYAVSADRRVSVQVPIAFTGSAVGVKSGGQLDVQKREVHLSVLPREIPETVTLDVGRLSIGDSLHVRDLLAALPSGAEILDDPDLTVVALVAPRVASESTGGATEPAVVGRGEADAN